MLRINKEILNEYGHGVGAVMITALSKYDVIKSEELDVRDLRKAYKYLVEHSGGREIPKYDSFKEITQKLRKSAQQPGALEIKQTGIYPIALHQVNGHHHLEGVHRRKRNGLISAPHRGHDSLVHRLEPRPRTGPERH